MKARQVAIGAVLAFVALTTAPSVGASAYRDDAAVRDALRAIPGVREALQAGRQRQAAVLVDRWLAPRVAAAYGPQAILRTFGSSAHDLLNAFAAGQQGVYCDGAADALVAALRLLGIAASRLDFGYAADGLTHTTVVVAAGGRWWLVDPTFELDLRGADERPLDLVAAWEAAADGTRDAVAMRTGDLSTRRVVGGRRPRAVCHDHAQRWTMCSLDTYLRGFAPALRRAGYPTGERGLLLLSLHSPLIGPEFYGVPARLARMRARVRRVRRPLRVVAAARGESAVVVTVRNVRRYPVPAVVSVHAGTLTRSRAAVVPAGTRDRIVLRLEADDAAVTVRVAVARYAAERDTAVRTIRSVSPNRGRNAAIPPASRANIATWRAYRSA